MAVVAEIAYYGGAASEPAGVNAETSIKFNKVDTKDGTTPPVVKPATADGTAFSYIKCLAIKVTTADAAVNLSNYRVYLGGTPSTGLVIAADLTAGAYIDQTGGTGAGADSGSDGALPTGFTALSTTPQQYDAGPDSGSGTGRKGDFCNVVLAVDTTYAGGGGSAISLPTLSIDFDEA
jgi:hypothetical protein